MSLLPDEPQPTSDAATASDAHSARGPRSNISLSSKLGREYPALVRLKIRTGAQC